MEDSFKKIKKMYEDAYKEHGDSPSSLLTPKGKNEIRFEALKPFLKNGKSILDYGCGLGYLLPFIQSQKGDIDYHGVDIIPDFIKANKLKYPHGKFSLITETEFIKKNYDIVFSSGVFNLKNYEDDSASRNYAFEKIKDLFEITKEVFVCDFLSKLVDFEQEGAQHFSIDEISNFCSKNLSKRFQIRHDLLPYEFTLVVWKEDKIKRPENYFI